MSVISYMRIIVIFAALFFLTMPAQADSPTIPSYVSTIEGRVKVLEYCHNIAHEYAARMEPKDEAMIEWANALERRWQKFVKVYALDEEGTQLLFDASDRQKISRGILQGRDPWMRRETALCNQRLG